jgi:hypothetical protein
MDSGASLWLNPKATKTFIRSKCIALVGWSGDFDDGCDYG